MGEIVRNESGVSQDNIDEPSIFDGLKPKPVYYSESAIYWYSTILGILFGGVLMAINCSNTEGKRGAWQVVVFSVLFMAIETVLFNYIIREYKWLHFVFNIAGAFILNQVFWEEYIGKNVDSK